MRWFCPQKWLRQTKVFLGISKASRSSISTVCSTTRGQPYTCEGCKHVPNTHRLYKNCKVATLLVEAVELLFWPRGSRNLLESSSLITCDCIYVPVCTAARTYYWCLGTCRRQILQWRHNWPNKLSYIIIIHYPIFHIFAISNTETDQCFWNCIACSTSVSCHGC